MGLTPSVLNFTHNPEIETLVISYMPMLEDVILPESPRLRIVDTFGPSKLTNAAIDHIVDVTYQSAVQFDIHEGHFGYKGNPLQGPSPSADRLVKLNALHNDYGWDLFPGY